jgi:hypothetical protein
MVSSFIWLLLAAGYWSACRYLVAIGDDLLLLILLLPVLESVGGDDYCAECMHEDYYIIISAMVHIDVG